MELKEGNRNKQRGLPKVSIAPLWNWKPWRPGRSCYPRRFNRTFMELKDCKSAPIIPGLKFQSHLYGIESGKRDAHTGIIRVSIAPLWNWKTVVSKVLSRRFGFNRTFMELKGVSYLILCVFSVVSIAPLWNWKPYTFNEPLAEIGFNRTFMELKVVRGTHLRVS